MNRHKMRELIDSLLEGDISEADFLMLEAELSVDESLRKEYLDRIALSSLLETEAYEELGRDEDGGDARVSATPGVSITSSDSNTWLKWTAGSAVLLSAVLAAFLVWSRGNVPSSGMPSPNAKTQLAETVEAEAQGYGVISGQDGVTWGDGVARSTGSLLPTGTRKLIRGALQLELFSGVSVVLEGPAEFAVTSPMHMRVESGKLRAHVPEPAHGFRVSTRDGDVVDLGTDFAVDVTQSRSEFHVLEGEIEVHSEGQNTRRLGKGQAVVASNSGLQNLQADRQRFVGQNEIAGRLQLARETRRNKWLAWSKELRSDSRLVAFYQPGQVSDEENDLAWSSNRRIANLASSGNSAESDRTLASEGAVVAAVRTTDRWQHRDGALDFSPAGSRVRLTVPGEHQSLTLHCWVKINSLDRWYNSLFLTDGHEQNEPHWQIMDDGRLFFSVKKRDNPGKGQKDKHVYYSPRFWDNSLSGQWLMITTVYDVERRLVTHYVNGKPISEESIPDDYLVERVNIRNASLCNWSLPKRDEPKFAVRNLNGSLDEFALFSAALTSDEIEEMYEHGKP